MSNYNWCHGPKCHERETTTRVRGNKGAKVLRTMKVSGSYRRSTWHEYFCDQTCLMEYINKHTRNIVAIAPCTEAKETPVTVTKEARYTYYGNNTYTKIEVDNA
tara:strand:+ start:222 stop:533 length:312 start_codon:yes stop_codon:yes gene_type:complete